MTCGSRLGQVGSVLHLKVAEMILCFFSRIIKPRETKQVMPNFLMIHVLKCVTLVNETPKCH